MFAKHLRRWGGAYLAVALAALLFKAHFVFGINSSASLPQHAFLIHNGEAPQDVGASSLNPETVEDVRGRRGNALRRRRRE